MLWDLSQFSALKRGPSESRWHHTKWMHQSRYWVYLAVFLVTRWSPSTFLDRWLVGILVVVIRVYGFCKLLPGLVFVLWFRGCCFVVGSGHIITIRGNMVKMAAGTMKICNINWYNIKHVWVLYMFAVRCVLMCLDLICWINNKRWLHQDVCCLVMTKAGTCGSTTCCPIWCFGA
ncbi:hypothetical protein Hanom_Chr12g01127491 [Helianthus anomalus]